MRTVISYYGFYNCLFEGKSFRNAIASAQKYKKQGRQCWLYITSCDGYKFGYLHCTVNAKKARTSGYCISVATPLCLEKVKQEINDLLRMYFKLGADYAQLRSDVNF